MPLLVRISEIEHVICELSKSCSYNISDNSNCYRIRFFEPINIDIHIFSKPILPNKAANIQTKSNLFQTQKKIITRWKVNS